MQAAAPTRPQALGPLPRSALISSSRRSGLLASATRRVVAFADEALEEEQAGTDVATARVRVQVIKQVYWGEHLRVVGGAAALGGWEVGAAPELAWSEGHRWSATLDLPVGVALDFKLVRVSPHECPAWEGCANRTLTAQGPAELTLDWGVAAPAAVAEEAEEEEAAAPALAAAAAVEEVEEAATITWDWMDSVRAKVGFNPLGLEESLEEATEAQATVEAVVEASAAAGVLEVVQAEEAAPEVVVAAEAAAKAPSSTVNTIMKTAGAVAMGVAAGAVMTALAVDITDMAILGAVAATAAMGSSSKGPASGEEGADGEEGGAEGGAGAGAGGKRKAKGSDPGVIIAAGVLSAFDVGQRALKVLDRPAAAAAAAAPEEEAAAARDEE